LGVFSDRFLAERPPVALEIGQVLGGAFAAIGRNWLAFLILTAALYVIPLAATTAVTQGLGRPDYSSLERGLATWGRTSLVSLPFYYLFEPLFAALVAWIVWADASKGGSDLLGALRGVAPRLPWIALTALMAGLIAGIGTILFIVPGVIATLAMYVAFPACAIEGMSATGAIRRSLELTRGQRWRVLGLLVIVFLISIVLSIFIRLISMMAGFSFAGMSGLVGIALRSGAGGIGAAISAAVGASAYVELRGAKEGIGAGEVAAVFA
jgi:uncharacterized membrane protein